MLPSFQITCHTWPKLACHNVCLLQHSPGISLSLCFFHRTLTDYWSFLRYARCRISYYTILLTRKRTVLEIIRITHYNTFPHTVGTCRYKPVLAEWCYKIHPPSWNWDDSGRTSSMALYDSGRTSSKVLCSGQGSPLEVFLLFFYVLLCEVLYVAQLFSIFHFLLLFEMILVIPEIKWRNEGRTRCQTWPPRPGLTLDATATRVLCIC